MHDLAELMEKTECIKDLKEKLVTCFISEMNTKGFECMDVNEAGEVVDMIKDLAETEKSCMEALYYQKLTEAMVSYEEPRYGESMGYNRNRSSSTGRYMSNRMGFMKPHTPYLEYDGHMYPQDYMNEAMMGYTPTWNMDNQTPHNYNNQSNENPRYGKAYNEYRNMRKHYTETKAPEDRREMNTHAEEHVNDTIATIRDIWKDADPELKKRMKTDFTKLVGEMDA